jgi:hypothetical protein
MLTQQVFAIKTLYIANQFLQFVNVINRHVLEIALSHRKVKFQASYLANALFTEREICGAKTGFARKLYYSRQIIIYIGL